MLTLAEEDVDKTPGLARIARAILFLSRHYALQPSLDEAAAAAGLSPFHFQREFVKAAGVSPKSFVAALTWELARERLRLGEPVLDAALGAGLSGPSRLHDLSMKIEAMTPGAYAKKGKGLRIAYGYHPTLFGTALLMATEKGLCGLSFSDEGDELRQFADMRARWPFAEFVPGESTIASYAESIFPAQGSGPGDIPVALYGTPWQIKVWQALLAIPEGRFTTYRAIAETVCTRKATRAAGAAIGRNPIALLIPCHRVLSASGAITGYHWGIDRKRALIAYELARTGG